LEWEAVGGIIRLQQLQRRCLEAGLAGKNKHEITGLVFRNLPDRSLMDWIAAELNKRKVDDPAWWPVGSLVGRQCHEASRVAVKVFTYFGIGRAHAYRS